MKLKYEILKDVGLALASLLLLLASIALVVLSLHQFLIVKNAGIGILLAGCALIVFFVWHAARDCWYGRAAVKQWKAEREGKKTEEKRKAQNLFAEERKTLKGVERVLTLPVMIKVAGKQYVRGIGFASGGSFMYLSYDLCGGAYGERRSLIKQLFQSDAELDYCCGLVENYLKRITLDPL